VEAQDCSVMCWLISRRPPHTTGVTDRPRLRQSSTVAHPQYVLITNGKPSAAV
jgi:hypothetical protein